MKVLVRNHNISYIRLKIVATNCEVSQNHPVDKNNLALKQLLNFFFIEIDNKLEHEKDGVF